jgi:cysteine desulfurase
VNIDVKDMNIHIIYISGKKVYGKKGVGDIYVRKSNRVSMEKIINGGGKESGLRSGNVKSNIDVGLGDE